jgi:hypothetical protein
MSSTWDKVRWLGEMKGFDFLYLDSNKPTVRRPMVKFVTLVSVGVGAGFPDEHSSKFGWDREFLYRYRKRQFVDHCSE